MTSIDCATHGKQEQTFVCRHIIATLEDGESRGFHWNKSGDDFQAICTTCNDMTDEDFAAAEPDLISVLCFGCFQDAAALNGVEIV